MIQLSAAGKRFGPKVLFQELDWLITPHDRVGLVGANGTGKTTLLKILGGIESLDYGAITQQRGIQCGYLPQDGLSLSGRSVFAECLSVFEHVHQMQREQEELAASMAEVDHVSAEYTQIAERFHRIQAEMQARDGYTIEAEVGTVLNGLGFSKEDGQRRTEEFSGGWQMRIALAKLLLQKPNLLLLDEPTNHLDLETRNWLEQYLVNYPHAYVLISHDRYFLDVTVKKTAEIWNKQVFFYSGNYEKYLAQKAERRAQLEAAYGNQKEKIDQLQAFINRFRYQATKAKQVQSRIKELDRMDKIEIPPEEKAIHFSFPQPRPSGRMVAEAKDLGKNYGPKHVFSSANFVIERGDRIALVGVNGAGKSTLIKLLAGSEQPTSGELRLGHNADVDYFAQDQYKALDPNARMLDDLFEAAPRSTQTELRSLLGCFLFLKTMSSRPSECFPAESATAMPWLACCCILRISCCSTSRQTILTCALRTCCWIRCRSSPARLYSFHTTAISLTSWQHVFLRLAMAGLRSSPATMKTISGARKERPAQPRMFRWLLPPVRSQGTQPSQPIMMSQRNPRSRKRSRSA